MHNKSGVFLAQIQISETTFKLFEHLDLKYKCVIEFQRVLQ